MAVATVATTGLAARVASADAIPVLISAGSASLVEGDVGVRTLDIPVTLSAPSTTAVTVHYAVTAGNATSGGLGSSIHFRTRKGTLSWRPVASTGVTTTERFVAVPITPNVIADGDETFAVTLSSAAGGFIQQAIGSGTIIDDDPSTGLPKVSVGDATVFAGDAGTGRKAVVPVTLSAPATSKVIVHYSIGGGTASSGVDYVAKATGTLTFAAGKAVAKTLAVSVTPHATPEVDKTLLVELTAVSGGAVIGRASGTVTIDDDAYQGNTKGPKVAAIGDSIVFVSDGRITDALADEYQSWVIGIPGYDIENALPALDQQLATAPDDVVSNLGTDDALEDNTAWQPNFDALMTRLSTVPCVELVTLNDVTADYFSSLNHGGIPVTVGADINTALTNAVATHSNMHLIDWKSAVEADPTLLADGIHPSDSGKQWLASHYRSALDQDC